MNEKNEQRVCIKFCVKLGKSATETFDMLRQAFHDHALGRTQVFGWHARFKSGRESVEDDERSGRPVTSRTPENVNKISELIHEDRRQTINELSALVGIGYGVCQEILTEDLNMRRIAAKFVPRLLTADQSQRLMCVTNFESWPTTIAPFFRESSQVMKAGATAMIQRQNNSYHSGRALNRRDRLLTKDFSGTV